MSNAEHAPNLDEPEENWEADIPEINLVQTPTEAQEQAEEPEQAAADRWAIETYVPQHLQKFREWAQDGKGANEQITNLSPLAVMAWISEQKEHPVSHTWTKDFIESQSLQHIAAQTGRLETKIALAISSAAQKMGYDVRVGKFVSPPAEELKKKFYRPSS